MDNDFLPEGYTTPDSSNGYFKFKAGENRIRITSRPILGWVWWTREDGTIKSSTDKPVKGDRPVRVRKDAKVPMEAAAAKHFWAMTIWNYEQKQIQILEITQRTIQKSIEALAKKSSWGTPLNYDLVIDKSGEGLDTEYTITPEPKTNLPTQIKLAIKGTTINLEALYDGKDPFSANEKTDGEVIEEPVEDLSLTEDDEADIDEEAKYQASL